MASGLCCTYEQVRQMEWPDVVNLTHYWATNPPTNELLEQLAAHFGVQRQKGNKPTQNSPRINSGSLDDLAQFGVKITRKPKAIPNPGR